MTTPDIPAQAGKLLTQMAGYVGVRTMQIGLRTGLLAALADHPGGLGADALATATGSDPFYVDVWCRSAYAAELLETTDSGAYRLAPHIDRLLLDADDVAYIGGMPLVLGAPEVFEQFEARLASGRRTWWDEASHDFIHGVSGTGRPFYTRLIPDGLARIPPLIERLRAGGAAAELACGAGIGLVRLAQAYPDVTLLGVDGDQFSLDTAQALVAEHGLTDRVALQRSTLEAWDAPSPVDLVYINISMHECRDLDEVTRNVHAALRPGGHFVISDMPFPATLDDCRTVPARIMCGIQFWEAQIDDQLLPTETYTDLLARHDFTDIAAIDLTPVHVVVHGRRP